MELNAENLLLTSGKANQIESEAKPTTVVGDGVASVGGAYLKAGINALNRGGLAVGYGNRYITLFNGTVNEPDKSTYVIIMQVQASQVEDTEAADTTEATEE